MATAVEFHCLPEHLAEKVHNLAADTLKALLLNSAPDADLDSVKADLPAEISAGNGYSAGGVTLTQSSHAESGGTWKLVVADGVITASGGTIGAFRYAVMYNDTPTSPADPLIQYWDYGSSITLADTESFTIDADATDGILQGVVS